MRSGLRFIRIQCNYPVCELAEKLGVTVEAVEDWENDRIPMPDAQAEKAAKIFGVDKTDIVDLTDQRKAELLASPRLRYFEGKKEHYCYRADPEVIGQSRIYACIGKERKITLTEELCQMKEEAEHMLERIRSMYEPPCEMVLRDQMRYIYRWNELVGRLVDVVGLLNRQKSGERMERYENVIELLDKIREELAGSVDGHPGERADCSTSCEQAIDWQDVARWMEMVKIQYQKDRLECDAQEWTYGYFSNSSKSAKKATKKDKKISRRTECVRVGKYTAFMEVMRDRDSE